MGRHASGHEPAADPRTHRRARLVRLAEHLAMGVGAGLVTALVLRWAGVSSHTAVLVGLAAVLVVPLLAWVASTVPAHPGGDDADEPSTRRTHR